MPPFPSWPEPLAPQRDRRHSAREAAAPGFDPRNVGQRLWVRITREAKLAHHAPKDLRDAYASWLLSLGCSSATSRASSATPTWA